MEIIKTENLTFSYPTSEKKILKNINFSVKSGEFVTVCGKSGCGKTTLLRLLKTALAPCGNLEGNIIFDGRRLEDISFGEQTEKIGFVMQSPDNQIVTDKVWHELAFGLESLGMKTSEIRARVSEMASFFGIADWFHKKVTELSGGQKQLLNLASVMVMQPSVLILDEPTSQLDPIAAQEFLKTLEKINKELGTTVILTEHRLEDAFPISERVIVMDEGEIIADAEPERVGEILKAQNHDMYDALPAPMRIFSAVENGKNAPLSVRDGRSWLEAFAAKNTLKGYAVKPPKREFKEVVIELSDVWFRYEKELSDVIKGFDLKVFKGELFAILGGNGTGKSTALSLISGLNTPYRGKVLIGGKRVFEISGLYNGVLGVLPQNPEMLFVKKTVYEDLLEMVSDKKAELSQKEEWVKNVSELCRIEDILKSHPYDISGGEKQRAALAKILLKNPHILLLDEPTKGMDASFKECFAEILEILRENGITIIMVSHDLEFCAKNADRCGLMFDGNLTSCDEPRAFFAGKSFYTTSSNRMARTTIPEAVLAEDIIFACGGTVNNKEKQVKKLKLPENEASFEASGKRKKWLWKN